VASLVPEQKEESELDWGLNDTVQAARPNFALQSSQESRRKKSIDQSEPSRPGDTYSLSDTHPANQKPAAEEKEESGDYYSNDQFEEEEVENHLVLKDSFDTSQKRLPSLAVLQPPVLPATQQRHVEEPKTIERPRKFSLVPFASEPDPPQRNLEETPKSIRRKAAKKKVSKSPRNTEPRV
jgi:hypothetical protein